jgi:hypothetical protein
VHKWLELAGNASPMHRPLNMEDAMNKMLGAGVSCAFGFACFTSIASASPAVNVMPTLLNRATFDPFSVRTDHDSPINFQAKAKTDVDVVVRRHDYAPGGNTGWHMHPGPVFITVKTGALTFYEYDDPTWHADRRKGQRGICGRRPWTYRRERNWRHSGGHLRDSRARGRRVP